MLTNGNKSESSARKCPDDRLSVAAVAQGAARGVDACNERAVGDNPAFPYMLDNFILGYHPFPVIQEIDQQRENLRLDADGLAAPGKLEPILVEGKVAKLERHYENSSPGQANVKLPFEQ
jgi:hypothetical protein